MRVPKHNPFCKTDKFYHTNCQSCCKDVLFWSCTCGISFLVEPNITAPWTRHNCDYITRSNKLKPREIDQIKKGDDSAANPLISCPFCEKKLKGKDLAKHVKSFHANDPKVTVQKRNNPTPFLDGVGIQSYNLIHEMNGLLIDENNFLVSPDLVDDFNIEKSSENIFHPTGSSHSKEQPHVFGEIKSTGKKRPSARKKKILPLPFNTVECPICHDVFMYKYLFDHVSEAHTELNAKIVLDRFNREHEIGDG